jgi:hypothetical protein
MRRQGAKNRHPKYANARRDPNPGNQRPKIRAEMPYLASRRKRVVCKDRMVEMIWTKTACSPRSDRTSLRNWLGPVVI